MLTLDWVARQTIWLEAADPVWRGALFSPLPQSMQLWSWDVDQLFVMGFFVCLSWLVFLFFVSKKISNNLKHCRCLQGSELFFIFKATSSCFRTNVKTIEDLAGLFWSIGILLCVCLNILLHYPSAFPYLTHAGSDGETPSFKAVSEYPNAQSSFLIFHSSYRTDKSGTF